MLFSHLVFTFVDTAVSPSLLALAMLKIILPQAVVLGPIHMIVGAFSVRLIVDPVTSVDIAVDMDKLALPVRSIVFPFTFVGSAICPNLLALSISETSSPLTLVLCTRPVRVATDLLSLVWVIGSIL